MKIGLNGQKLLTESPAGPEKYTYNLFRALAKIDKENIAQSIKDYLEKNFKRDIIL